MKKNKKQKNSGSKKYILLFLVFVVSLTIFLAYKLLLTEDESIENSRQAGIETTSTAETAQSDFSEGNDRPVPDSTNTDRGNATITDTNGSGEITNQDGISSQSGNLTVLSPTKSQVLLNGDIISGITNNSLVDYRIIDSISGVIATGRLVANNGKFSGTVSFTTNATDGQIDFFHASDDGNELDTVSVPVRFK